MSKQSQLNLQINAIAFADNQPSNNPLLRHFDLTLKLMGIAAKNPDQRPYTIPAQSTQTIYDGTRSTAIDGTTQFTVTKPYADKDVYRFTNSNGAGPAFRTARSIGITTSTQLQVVMNGPVATFTALAGPLTTTSIQAGDILNILSGSGASPVNEGRFTIIAKTANSISIQNINAANETFNIIDATKFLIYSNGGASNQVQLGDKVIISSGFSIATQGTYDVSEVTPSWFEIAVGAAAGIPLESNITPNGGLVFYKEAKKFLLIAAQQSVSARLNADTSDSNLIEPIEPGMVEKAGVLLKNGSFYKLVIANNGLSDADVIVATVE